MPTNTTKVITDADITAKMLELRTVGLMGEITQKSMSNLGSELIRLQLESNTEPVNLIISSGGGDTDAGFAMYDHICHILTVPVHALVIGECGSAATFVLLACEKRVALPHSKFLLHSSTIRGISLPINEITPALVAKLSTELNRYDELLTTFYMEKLGKSKDEVKALLSRGDGIFNQMLFADEALKIGLITEILTSGKAGIFPEHRD